MNSFYEILGCCPKDSPEKIRRAFLNLAMKHHPDKGGDEEKFKEISHAYNMITNPEYARKQSNHPVRDLTFHIQMIVPFDDAFYGTKLVLSYNQITLDKSLNPVKTDKIEIVCFSFDLPPGSMQGFRHIEKRKGKLFLDQIGDAIVTVSAEKHPRYTVKGPDVIVEEKIKLEVLLKGDYLVVETLWGLKTVWVPPGTIPGDRIRVVGCGVAKKGHQYCTVVPIFPDKTDLKNNDTWKSLGINWTRADDQNRDDDELFKKFESMKK